MTGAGLHLVDAFVNLAGPICSVDARSVSKKAPPDPRDVVAVLAQFCERRNRHFRDRARGAVYWRVHVFGTDGMAEARGEDTLIVTKIGGQPQETTYDTSIRCAR